LMAVMSAENSTELRADGVYTFRMPQAIRRICSRSRWERSNCARSARTAASGRKSRTDRIGGDATTC
jgi:hypothetical protein